MAKRRFVARKVDANQPEIVAEFRALGWSVAITSQLGHGFPDIVVGKFDHNFLVEIKDGSLPPGKRKLSPDEQDFASSWRGQYCVIQSREDVHKFNAEHGAVA